MLARSMQETPLSVMTGGVRVASELIIALAFRLMFIRIWWANSDLYYISSTITNLIICKLISNIKRNYYFRAANFLVATILQKLTLSSNLKHKLLLNYSRIFLKGPTFLLIFTLSREATFQ